MIRAFLTLVLIAAATTTLQGNATAEGPAAYFILSEDGGVVDTPTLFTTDLATGESEEIGELGGGAEALTFGPLAFTPDGSTLYALSETPEFSTDPMRLFAVDTATGAAAFVGTLIRQSNSEELRGFATGLTVAADGTLLLTGFVGGTSGSDTDDSFVIDIAAEASEEVPVSELGSDTGFLTSDMDTAVSIVYGVSFELVPDAPLLLTTVDPTTGTVTPVGPLGGPFVFTVTSDLPHIAFEDPAGVLWAVAATGGIYTVDQATGDTDATGNNVTLDSAIVDVPNLAITHTPAPTLIVNDVSRREGDTGRRTFRFTVARSGDLTFVSSVQVQTMNGSARSPRDYVALPPTSVDFASGEVAKTVIVTVKGDRRPERTERFVLSLSDPSGAVLADGTATGKIRNDD